MEPEYGLKLMIAAVEKLKQFAPIFEINVATNNFCQAVQRWLDVQPEASEADADVA